MQSYQHDQPSDIKATSAVAYSWMIDKLEMAEFEPRDRLTLWAFLDLVMSHPFRISTTKREMGESNMREAFVVLARRDVGWVRPTFLIGISTH